MKGRTPKAKLGKRKCKHCEQRFQKLLPLQFVCSPKCGIGYEKAKKQKAFNKETRRLKEKIKTKRQWAKEAQIEFNRFVRFRDHKEPCVSCGRYDSEITERLTGGKWDCGHYLTVGAHPELRFNEDNAHKQCKTCNGGSGKYTKKNYTVGKEYRELLIIKVGLEKVEWLEGPHEAANRTIEDLKEIKATYRKKANELDKQIKLEE